MALAAGTAVRGWRIIRTLGHKMVKLHPINGFAAETSSATVIAVATQFGIPVSTTHNISGNHGSGRRQTLQRHSLDSCGTNALGLALYHSGECRIGLFVAAKLSHV